MTHATLYSILLQDPNVQIAGCLVATHLHYSILL